MQQFKICQNWDLLRILTGSNLDKLNTVVFESFVAAWHNTTWVRTERRLLVRVQGYLPPTVPLVGLVMELGQHCKVIYEHPKLRIRI
ncbi:MAG: hypothetical protein MET45_08085 [Nostoc sp. LLA-1]|nr:hypothetical protein [Cyanocohniella sp. LLY]